MEYWITNPNLTPEHDHKIAAGALAMMTRSGWQVRDDQDDPVEAVGGDEVPLEPAPEPAANDPAPDPEPLDHEPAAAPDPEPSTTEPVTTKKKGEV